MKNLDVRDEQGNEKVSAVEPQAGLNKVAKPPGRANGAVYLCAKSVEFYSFDQSYFRLLQQGDGPTRGHFVSYFSKLLGIKLRSRKLTAEDINDVRQETFVRVLLAARQGKIQQPERLGSYVSSVCNHVVSELYRERYRKRYRDHVDLDRVDVPDPGADLERSTISNERARRVHAVLARLSHRDRALLRAVLEGRDKDEICRELDVDRTYLRVVMHRAIANFRKQLRKDSSRLSQAAKR